MSSGPRALTAALAPYGRTATVEAEYGDDVVMGTVLTMAHHGPRAGQKAPCAYGNGCVEGIEAVGLSHFDLDSLGGCAALLGRKIGPDSFWDLAEFIDLNGPHKIDRAGASPENIARLWAYWAWGQHQRFPPPRGEEVAVVTDKVTASLDVLDLILADDPELLAAGAKAREEAVALNSSSYRRLVDASVRIVVRSSERFVSSLYTTPDGTACAAVLAYNEKTQGITLSFADPPVGPRNAMTIMQEVFGPLAGGHASIAGTPRGEHFFPEDMNRVLAALGHTTPEET